MYFGKNLRYLRHKRDMSQQDLADILGYKADVTVQHWESGRSTPKVGVMQKICNLFGVDIETLCYKDMEQAEINSGVIVDIEHSSPEIERVKSMMERLSAYHQKIVAEMVKQLCISLGEKEKQDAKSKENSIGKLPG